MPASHVELRRVEDFTGYVGKELEAEIIEVDLEKKRIVVSRRDLLRAEADAKRKAYKEAKEARIAAAKEHAPLLKKLLTTLLLKAKFTPVRL